MADENTAEAVEAAEGAEQVQSDSDEVLGDGGKKALDAERKARADAEKAAKDYKAQLDALNDAKLTETERLQKQLDELSSRYDEERRSGFRKDAVSKAELPAFLSPQVEGDTFESMLESAVALKAAFDAEVESRKKPGTPAPDPSQGASGAGAGGSTTSQFEQFFNSKLG